MEWNASASMAQALFTNGGPQSTLETRRKKDTGIPAERRGFIAAAYGALIANRHQNTGLLQKRKYHNLEICLGKAAEKKPPTLRVSFSGTCGSNPA